MHKEDAISARLGIGEDRLADRRRQCSLPLLAALAGVAVEAALQVQVAPAQIEHLAPSATGEKVGQDQRTQAQAGRIKLIGITNQKRVPGLDLPTAQEAGFPELNFDGLVGVWGVRSSGFSDAARERIAADVKAVSVEPQVVERLTATAQMINPGTGAELSQSIEEQAGTLRKVAQSAGIQPKF